MISSNLDIITWKSRNNYRGYFLLISTIFYFERGRLLWIVILRIPLIDDRDLFFKIFKRRVLFYQNITQKLTINYFEDSTIH